MRLQQLTHAGHDIGLGNGLLEADGKGAVFIGASPVCLGQRGGGARSASPGGLSLCRFHGPAAGFPPYGNAGGLSSYLPDRQGISQYLSLQHLLSQYPQAFVLALSFSRYPVDEVDEEEEDKDPCHGYQQQEDAAYEGKQILKEAN